MTSESSDPEQDQTAENYDAWLRAKVLQARSDPRSSVPHDEAMARVRGKIEEIVEFHDRQRRLAWAEEEKEKDRQIS